VSEDNEETPNHSDNEHNASETDDDNATGNDDGNVSDEKSDLCDGADGDLGDVEPDSDDEAVGRPG